MSARAKAVSTQLKEALAELDKVKKDLASTVLVRDNLSRENDRLSQEIESVHNALDLLGAGSRIVKVGYYDRPTSISSRLFAWAGSALFGTVKKQTPVEPA